MKYQLQPTNIQPALIEACNIVNMLHDAGFTAYIVGGAVRDALMQRPISDIDIATSAQPEQVMAVFTTCIPTGLKHGTVTVIENEISYEITTYRTESQYENHRQPTAVQFVNDITTDLLRRDFTMNALALDTSFNIIDISNGQADLQARRLRCVGNSVERFEEDALRMVRAIRFCTTYELAPSHHLWRAMKLQKSLLSYVAMERIHHELEKMLQKGQLQRALSFLVRSGLLHHTKEKMYFARSSTENMLNDVSLTKLEHLYAKWATLYICANMEMDHIAHDLRALKQSNDQRSSILQLIDIFNKTTALKMASEAELQLFWAKLLLQHNEKTVALFLKELLPVFHKVLPSNLLVAHQNMKITSIKQLVVNGKDILKWTDKPSGAWLKQCLEHLTLQVALGQLSNDKASIYNYVISSKGGFH